MLCFDHVILNDCYHGNKISYMCVISCIFAHIIFCLLNKGTVCISSAVGIWIYNHRNNFIFMVEHYVSSYCHLQNYLNGVLIFMGADFNGFALYVFGFSQLEESLKVSS